MGQRYWRWLIVCGVLQAILVNADPVYSAERGIGLTWVDNSDNEAAFQVERKMDASAFALINTTGVDVTSWRDVVTQPGVYTWRVRACNAVGCSAYSNEASLTITAGDFPPTAPGDLSVALEQAGQALLKAADAAKGMGY